MLVAAVAKPTNEVRTTVTTFVAEPRSTTQSVGVAYGAVAVMRTVYVALVLPFISVMSATESSPAASVRILPPRKAFKGVTPGTLALPAGVPFTSHWEAPVKFAIVESSYLLRGIDRCQATLPAHLGIRMPVNLLHIGIYAILRTNDCAWQVR